MTTNIDGDVIVNIFRRGCECKVTLLGKFGNSSYGDDNVTICEGVVSINFDEEISRILCRENLKHCKNVL